MMFKQIIFNNRRLFIFFTYLKYYRKKKILFNDCNNVMYTFSSGMQEAFLLCTSRRARISVQYQNLLFISLTHLHGMLINSRTMAKECPLNLLQFVTKIQVNSKIAIASLLNFRFSRLIKELDYLASREPYLNYCIKWRPE